MTLRVITNSQFIVTTGANGESYNSFRTANMYDKNLKIFSEHSF